MDKRPGYSDLSRRTLSALVLDTTPAAWEWPDGELGDILSHQLRTSLTGELAALAKTSGRTAKWVADALAQSGATTFVQVFEVDPPPVDALWLVKEYAKQSVHSASDLPPDVARVLYVLSVLRALRAGAVGFSSLDAVRLEREARRCRTFGWLPEAARTLLRRNWPTEGGLDRQAGS